MPGIAPVANPYGAFCFILSHAFVGPGMAARVDSTRLADMLSSSKATCTCEADDDQKSLTQILEHLNTASGGVMAKALSLEKADPCADIIPDSSTRNSAWRLMHTCKCMPGSVVVGNATGCDKVHGQRYFPADVDLKGKCRCERERAASSGIPGSVEVGNCCKSYAPKFGNWGTKQCPSSLAEVIADLESSSDVANGGASGVAVTITKKYVLKVIDGHETDMLYGLLDELPSNLNHTFLNPACFIIRLKGDGTSLLISPQIGLNVDSDKYSDQRKFDLKGNFEWKGRGKDNLDLGFTTMFPDGMFVAAVSFQTRSPEDAIDLLMRDSKILGLALGLMDYSLYAHVVGISEEEFNARANGAVATGNPDMPLLWAQSGKKYYIMTMGIIDMLMNENMKGPTAYKRAYNWVGNNIVYQVQCRATDPDPVDAIPYRVRFLRMFGFYASADCGQCLFKQYTNCYTYFKSAYQQQMREQDSCAWAGGGKCA